MTERSNAKYREQVADVILKDANNNDLVVTSRLYERDDGAMVFIVGEDTPNGARYRVVLKIEEI